MSGFETVDILLVEDNPTDGELTLRALRKGKLANHIVWLRDGAEALDFLFRSGSYSERPDVNPKLILLDIKLPKVDGIEVLKRIKADERTRIIPVVMVTSSAEGRDITDSYKLGVNSYVVKPVEFEQFSETVSKAGFYWMLMNKTP
ncbi:MAG: response regulator [Betaproteobacteria bacterium]|nr:response regulator [Betaproteobacteria bacterium]